MTEYKLNHFTMADAQALAGKTADITEWDDDELETKVTYPGARITGIIVLSAPCLVIETAGAVITDARTGERLGTRPPAPSCACPSPGSARSAACAAGSSAATGSPLSTPTTRTPGSGPATREPSPATTPGLGQLDVRWDSGSTLSMLLDEGDRVRLVTPAPEAGTGEAGKEPGR